MLYISNNCSTTGDVPFKLHLVSHYLNTYMYHNHFPKHHYVHISKSNSKPVATWSLLRSGRMRYRCGTCMYRCARKWVWQLQNVVCHVVCIGVRKWVWQLQNVCHCLHSHIPGAHYRWACMDHQPHNWVEWEMTVLDQARRRKELMIKEAFYIRLTPEVQRFNRDGGLELPACWAVTLKVLHAERPLSGLSKINVRNWVYAILKLMVWLSPYKCVVPDTLKRARALGQNVSISLCFVLHCSPCYKPFYKRTKNYWCNDGWESAVILLAHCLGVVAWSSLCVWTWPQ